MRLMAHNKSDFFSYVFLACLTLQGGTDGLSQNIDNHLPTYTVYVTLQKSEGLISDMVNWYEF
jgi:hypothetical protein